MLFVPLVAPHDGREPQGGKPPKIEAELSAGASAECGQSTLPRLQVRAYEVSTAAGPNDAQ